MRTFDLSPLYRSTVGFDRLFNLLDGVSNGEAQPYPPYNIERTGENAYRVTMAVAGFGEDDLDVQAKENVLTVKGEKKDEKQEGAEVLYRGIAARAFERRFQLADHVEVRGASAGQRPAPHRPGTRDSGGHEAPQDRHRRLQGHPDRRQGRLTRQPERTRNLQSAPRHRPGRFYFRSSSGSAAKRLQERVDFLRRGGERRDKADQRLVLVDLYVAGARPFVEDGAGVLQPLRGRRAIRPRTPRCLLSATPRAPPAHAARPARSLSAIALACRARSSHSPSLR